MGKALSKGRVGHRKGKIYAEPHMELPGSRKSLDLSVLHSVELLALLDFTPPPTATHCPSLSSPRWALPQHPALTVHLA